jgi:MFS family permease
MIAGALWWRLANQSTSANGSRSASPGDTQGEIGSVTGEPGAVGGGFRTVFTSRIFIAYVPLAFFSSGGFSAVQSLWAGPWLIEVAGHTRAASAEVLFAYGLALFAGYLGAGLIGGRLQATPGAPRRFYIGGLFLASVSLAAIISNAWAASSWPWFAYGLTLGTGMLAYPALTRTFPAAIAGRVVTAYNFVMFVGAFALQWAIGALIQKLINGGTTTPFAYQVSFGCLLVAQVLSLVWFWALSRQRA